MSDLIIAILATYGVVHLITQTDGLFDVFHKLRSVKNKTLEKLFSCSKCQAVYISAIPVIGLHMSFWEYLATIGGVIILTEIEW